MRGRLHTLPTAPTISSRTPWCARYPSFICGSRGPIFVLGFSPSAPSICQHGAARGARKDGRHRARVIVAHGHHRTARRQLIELDRALALLPNEQREVVLLVGLEGMPYETVAQILGVPIGTVRSRLPRGRERLRELMGRDREPQPASSAANTDATPMQPPTVSRSEAA
jgi:hypothetical protein